MFGLFNNKNKEKKDMALFHAISILIDSDCNASNFARAGQKSILQTMLSSYGRNVEFYNQAKAMSDLEMGGIFREMSQMDKRTHAETFTCIARESRSHEVKEALRKVISICDIPTNYIQWKLL